MAVFNRTKSAKELDALLQQMLDAGLVTRHEEATGGRPKQVYTRIPDAIEESTEESPT